MESHLLRMRGLKLLMMVEACFSGGVASFTDAWIETVSFKYESLGSMSHLLRMRGLKPIHRFYHKTKRLSHLLRMRGLKLYFLFINFSTALSHLLRMRGLKRSSCLNRQY